MLVPKLRFKEFNDEWENYSFNDVFLLLNNNSLSRSELNYNYGDYRNIHYGDILIKYSNILDCSKSQLPFINSKIDIKKWMLLKDNDIIFADTAEDYTTGKCCELINVNNIKIIAGLHTIPCRTKIDIGSKYLGYYLNSHFYHRQLLPLITGTKVYGISKNLICSTDIVIPNNKEEEKKIGDFLSLLDKKIELQTKKIEALKLYKLYAKNEVLKAGDKVCRLSEILIKWNEKNKSGEINYVESISNKYGFVSQNEQFEDRNVASKELNNYYVIRKNVFGYNPSRLNVGSLALKENDKVSVVSPLYECFTTNQNSKFLLEWFNSNYFKKGTISKFEGGVRNTLNFTNLCDIEINLPTIEKQNKYSKYFECFDKKMALEYDKLNKIIALKKGIMQNMFV